MKTVEVHISIPVAGRHSPDLILSLIRETLEDRFMEVEDIGNDKEETAADIHGFGGNTITITSGQLTEEICL